MQDGEHDGRARQEDGGLHCADDRQPWHVPIGRQQLHELRSLSLAASRRIDACIAWAPALLRSLAGSAMSQSRFVAFAAAVGVAIPLVWLAIYWTFLRGNPSLINSIMSGGHLDRVLVAIWPSWLFLIADPEERSVVIPAAAVAVNALLYGAVGWLVWFGLNRRRLVLPVVAVGVLAGWYALLRWYVGA
ncbi:MAG: hypothetical protein IPM15_07220 [Betaproteobacteria bacterium]|nr:hypothetical protein [Betaproteobacteria bacterium]